MAHLSESIPAPAHNLGPLWGFFGEGDRTQWQWEAPTSRNSRESSAPALPAWLVEWDTSSPTATEPVPSKESTGKVVEETSSPERSIIDFRTMLRAAHPYEVLHICDEFNQRFKQSLSLGLVSEETIYNALRTVSEDIRLAFSKSDLVRDRHLLSFYQAFWDGLVTCKVLQPADLDAKIFIRFLSCVRRLSIRPEVHILFHGIIQAASITQLAKMSTGLNSLAKSWSRSWLHEQPIGDSELSLMAAQRALSESANKLLYLHNLTNARDTDLDNRHDFSMLRRVLREAKGSFDYTLEAILEAEKVIMPLKASIDALSNVLSYLPSNLLHPLLHSCTNYIITMYNSMETPKADLYYGWLSLVAKLPELHDRAFVKIIKQMEKCKGTSRHSIPSDIVLSRWITRGHISQGALVRNTFEISTLECGSSDPEFLLLAIDRHREGVFNKTKALFKLLCDLGRYKDVYKILAGMRRLRMKVPIDIIAPTIKTASRYDPKFAYSIYQLCLRLCVDKRPYLNPNFILPMIHHRGFQPQSIWKLLRIPIYDDLKRYERSQFSGKRLSPFMTKLITKVAIAFAHSDARPQRVAFRNVLQCLHHLRRHNAPITSDLTRAISHAGFTRKIIAGRWISKEQLRWALGLIELAEGTEVAIITEKAVTYWNEQLEAKQQKEARESNVLRVGPIN
jgi:hypothetical protein